jgi:hypothetical protein
MNMSIICIDVGGSIFRFSVNTLKKYPQTLLGEMFSAKSITVTNAYVSNGELRYFFDKNPAIFNIVAEFYRSGKYRMPKPPECSYKMVADELDFWRIPHEACSSPADKAIAEALIPVLRSRKFLLPIYISSLWLETTMWKDGNIPEQLLAQRYNVDIASTKDLVRKIEDQVLPGSGLMDAIRRNGIDTYVEIRKVLCSTMIDVLVCDGLGRLSTVIMHMYCDQCKRVATEDGFLHHAEKDKCKSGFQTCIIKKWFIVIHLRDEFRFMVR